MRLTLAVSTIVLLLFATYGVAAPSMTSDAEASSFPAADLSTNLTFRCQSDGLLSADFRWQSSGQGPQWLDVSRFDDNFSSYFLGHGPIPSGQGGITWYGLEPNAWFFVRVNTLTAGGWFASPTMQFLSPADCQTVTPPTVANPGSATCPGLVADRLSGCVWNERPDYGVYGINEQVNYCYYVTRPAEVQVVASKPDGTSLIVVDGYVNATGACLGPFSAYYPLGLRTVRLYGDGYLLDETHFYVDD